jgi:hypothetical protein
MAGIRVIVGSHRRVRFFDSKSDQVFTVQQILINPFYNKSDLQGGSDIAIIRLNKKVTISANVGLVCLPTSPNDYADIIGKDVVTIGWGSITGYTGDFYFDPVDGIIWNYPMTLHQTKMKVIDGDVSCNIKPGAANYCVIDSVRETTICSGI